MICQATNSLRRFFEICTLAREWALAAFGGAGGAESPAVPHEAVAKKAAFFGRDELPQVVLDFSGFRVFSETETVCESYAVGVDHVGRLAEGVAQDKVRGLPAHAR